MSEVVSGDVTRVGGERLHTFALEVATRIGLVDDHARALADALAACDMRGLPSHGTRLLGRYVREVLDGRLNPRPGVAVANEGPTHVTVDGDGGLGYFPAYEATRRVIHKARDQGMAAAVTRNHGHIGAAGLYTRLTLEHDLLTFMTSGVRLRLEPGQSVVKAAGASPMSFTAPTLGEPAVVLDVGVTHDIQGNAAALPELVGAAPRLVLRALGFGTICQAWGGLLTGLSFGEEPAWSAANQGAMMFALRIDLFCDVDRFKREMDEYVRQTRRMRPLDGTAGAYLPGGVEADNERRYAADGVPLGPGHRRVLEEVGGELGVAPPWAGA